MKSKILKIVSALVIAVGALLGVLKLVQDALIEEVIPVIPPDSTVVDTLSAVTRSIGLG